MPLMRQAASRDDLEVVPEDTYEITCMDVKPETWKEDKFGNLNKVRFFLETQDTFDSEGNPARIEAVCNDKWSEKATLWLWCEAFGLHPSYDEATDIEDCIGKKALAKVTIAHTREGKPFNTVERMMALPAGRRVQNKEPVNAPSDAEPDYSAFWKQVRAMGKGTEDVRVLLPGQDMVAMQDQTAADLVELLEKLSA